MTSDVSYHNIFKNRYHLTGRRDWVRLLSAEDLMVFVRIGLAAADYGRMGGRARADSAIRDGRGRFAKNGGSHE